VPITICGIKNCDTMKKARAWLDVRQLRDMMHKYGIGFDPDG
jgi:arsenate reductase (glutaredoxin)